MEKRYLKLLAKEYPTIESAASEIINLNAIQCLPKGTEYFFSDLHGEYEAFIHLLKSASGVIRTKIDDLFGKTISKEDRIHLAELIYYPERQLNELSLEGEALEDWQRITIYRLVQVCKKASSKYTRSKVRKKMPTEYAYILDELLHADEGVDKEYYYQSIIQSIVDMGSTDNFIMSICTLIQELCIDRLHIIGDIYDRGPRPDIIMNELEAFHDVDIQWGNHDISWMGAASGNRALIANVIRMAIHYNNFDLIEDGYGISLRVLATFASEVYQKDVCALFVPYVWDENKYAPVSLELAAKMHKAITIIQFKLEGQLIENHPEYQMEDRMMLNHIDYKRCIITINNKEYELKDSSFPTISPKNPFALTKEEEELMQILEGAFKHSKILHKHIRFLYSHGSMYKCVNNNLLYHGCIPMTVQGELEEIKLDGKAYKGKEYLDYLNIKVNEAYFAKEGSKEKKSACDFMWYLWCGRKSPLFGKSKLACFEQYYLMDEAVKKEVFNPYYNLSQKEEICDLILEDFHMDKNTAHIINGHVPVKIKDGESPIKANGKLFIIDGGISKAYQSKTGIAGYTLIYNSRTLNLAEHKPFVPNPKEEFHKQTPKVSIIERMNPRVTVAKTDIGRELQRQVEELQELIAAYREGVLKEIIR